MVPYPLGMNTTYLSHSASKFSVYIENRNPVPIVIRSVMEIQLSAKLVNIARLIHYQ